MGQRGKILTQIAGIRGFKVVVERWESAEAALCVPIGSGASR